MYGDVIVFLQRKVIESIDRISDLDLLFEGKFDGILGKFEIGDRRFDSRNNNLSSGIENKLHETMGMAAFLS